MIKREKVLSKIVKLLQKADPTKNEFEAEVEQALIMVARLMRDHNIDEAEVAAAGLNNGGIIERMSIVKPELNDADLSLASVVLVMCNVKAVTRHYVNKTSSIVFIGPVSDVDMAVVMFLSLTNLITARVNSILPKPFGTDHARRSFCMGFIHNISKRVHERKKAEAAETVTEKYALVVAAKNTAMDKYIETLEVPPTKEEKLSDEDICPISYRRGFNSGGDASIDINKSIE